MVGSYWTHTPAASGFARLELKANGHYAASVDPAGRFVCVTSPCLLPESGTWNASKKVGGGFRLRIRPTGQASRWYDATKTGGASATLTLSRSGVTETLAQLGANACLDSADCKPNEECGPKFCLMYCAFGDPFCCGPSTCQPKAPPPPAGKFCGGIAGIACAANEECVDDPTDGCDPKHGGADCGGVCQPKPPPPPPACAGAWLDQNGRAARRPTASTRGVLRGSVDAVRPDELRRRQGVLQPARGHLHQSGRVLHPVTNTTENGLRYRELQALPVAHWVL